MSLVRRRRFMLTNSTVHVTEDCVGIYDIRWSSALDVLQTFDGVCHRCKHAYRKGDNLVYIKIDSEDSMEAASVYHYRCIPSARWNAGRLAGSLPAWDLPSDGSAEKATPSAGDPTIRLRAEDE